MKPSVRNPFEFAGAASLPPEIISEVYVPDFNYQRLINSTRNVFLFGERGSGKSMTLLFHSLPIQLLRREAGEPHEIIGVFTNCNTPLFHRREHRLLDEGGYARGAIIAEHVLVMWIAQAICGTLSSIQDEFRPEEMEYIRDDLSYVLGLDIRSDRPLFKALGLALQRKSVEAQDALNRHIVEFDSSVFYNFSSLIVPILTACRQLEALKHAHFALMVDDAQHLNQPQRAALNSWISFRDHSLFSLKVAAPKGEYVDLRTSSGSTILEGHDYISIDVEQQFQNERSPFYKLAKDIVEKRLSRAGINAAAEEFFPQNESFATGIRGAEEEVRNEFDELFPGGSDKQRVDYVYKYGRARYFRNRDPKANLPPYSGFDTIVHLSTGVIRNLLEPCFWMFDDAISKSGSNFRYIEPATQSHVIRNRSQALWDKLEKGLDNNITNCSREQALQLYRLFDNLGILFRERLRRHKTEPRVLSFSVSAYRDDPETYQKVLELLEIARKAQLLYVRSGVAKDRGRRETYFTPNRLLWPVRGLDPFGQHGRVSLKLSDIWAAAHGQSFPFVEDDAAGKSTDDQLKLGV